MQNGDLNISQIMVKDVLTAGGDMSTMDALRRMAKRKAGSIVITEGRTPVGMFTERDLLYKVVLKGKSPEKTPLNKVMTKRIVSISPDTPFDVAHQKMLDGNCRHLLVVGAENELLGIISVKDLIRTREQVLEQDVDRKTREIGIVRDKLSESLSLIKKEMAFAGGFQRQLIEKKFPSFRKTKISHVFQQADSIGGDYFSVIGIDREHAGILMADVMGHGITSAMIAVEVKMQYDMLSKRILFPGVLIGEMNRTISPLMPPGFFVAGCCCVLNLKTLHLRYTQFGLPGPGIYRQETRKFESLKPCQVPMGIKPDASYPENDFFIMPGDKLLLYTDGCIEQKNSSGRLLGQKRFTDQFKRLVRAQKKNVASELYNFVIENTGNKKPGDDIAILLFEFSRNHSRGAENSPGFPELDKNATV